MLIGPLKCITSNKWIEILLFFHTVRSSRYSSNFSRTNPQISTWDLRMDSDTQLQKLLKDKKSMINEFSKNAEDVIEAGGTANKRLVIYTTKVKVTTNNLVTLLALMPISVHFKYVFKLMMGLLVKDRSHGTSFKRVIAEDHEKASEVVVVKPLAETIPALQALATKSAGISRSAEVDKWANNILDMLDQGCLDVETAFRAILAMVLIPGRALGKSRRTEFWRNACSAMSKMLLVPLNLMPLGCSGYVDDIGVLYGQDSESFSSIVLAYMCSLCVASPYSEALRYIAGIGAAWGGCVTFSLMLQLSSETGFEMIDLVRMFRCNLLTRDLLRLVEGMEKLNEISNSEITIVSKTVPFTNMLNRYTIKLSAKSCPRLTSFLKGTFLILNPDGSINDLAIPAPESRNNKAAEYMGRLFAEKYFGPRFTKNLASTEMMGLAELTGVKEEDGTVKIKVPETKKKPQRMRREVESSETESGSEDGSSDDDSIFDAFSEQSESEI